MKAKSCHHVIKTTPSTRCREIHEFNEIAIWLFMIDIKFCDALGFGAVEGTKVSLDQSQTSCRVDQNKLLPDPVTRGQHLYFPIWLPPWGWMG